MPQRIDFTELGRDGKSLEQLVREMLLILDLRPRWSGCGADQGRDILVGEPLSGPLSPTGAERSWLVQCKHYAHSNRSVGRKDVGAFDADCRQAGATAYLLVCSTQPSSGLVTKLREISQHPENRLFTHFWDSVDLEKKLFEPRFFALGHLFFPKSFSSRPWKLWNRGAPNIWSAHYRTYFVHLSSRIAGQHPNLVECERIFRRVEGVRLRGKEWFRPRAIRFDDYNGAYEVCCDYLVPTGGRPKVAPNELHRLLGYEIDGPTAGTSYPLSWHIKVAYVDTDSDHFNIDHPDYYEDAWRGVALTLEDMCGLGQPWPPKLYSTFVKPKRVTTEPNRP